jgi:hypothetical protein
MRAFAAVILLQLVAQGDDPVAGARADGLTYAQLARLQRRQIAQQPVAERYRPAGSPAPARR